MDEKNGLVIIVCYKNSFDIYLISATGHLSLCPPASAFMQSECIMCIDLSDLALDSISNPRHYLPVSGTKPTEAEECVSWFYK